MTPDGLTSFLAKAAGAALAMFVAATNASAQDSFYKGKLVTVYIGEVTGGALDAYARVLAAGLNRHLPGCRNIMWSSDYPHSETTFLHSHDIITTS